MGNHDQFLHASPWSNRGQCDGLSVGIAGHPPNQPGAAAGGRVAPTVAVFNAATIAGNPQSPVAIAGYRPADEPSNAVAPVGNGRIF